GGNVIAAAEHRHMLDPLAQRRPGYVHGRVPRADDHQVAAQVVDVGVDQVVDGKMDVAQALAGDAQFLGPPDAGADEDGLVAVPLQIVDGQGLADGCVGPDLDAQLFQLGLVPVQDLLGQPEFGDAVAQHAADLLPAFKKGDAVALLRQPHRDGEARRPRADDGHPLPLGRLRLELHPIQVGVRNVIFDAGDVYRRALDALDAMPLALLFVVADQRTDHRQGVVAEKHLPRFLQPVLPEQADHVRDGRLDGTACAAAGIFAL